jgi:hypothetical protein
VAVPEAAGPDRAAVGERDVAVGLRRRRREGHRSGKRLSGGRGEARYLYLSWKHGGHDPFRLYHDLDDDYRPLGGTQADRVHLPPSRRRVRLLVYAFAAKAEEDALALAGAKTSQKAAARG